ncbi:hypothetical protein [Belnapia rosea]|uniref:hypothetical protein n=1 Tax=Belnapia rosea TaxID=938405 RepID=UPI00115FC25F|nr:hypothetical protein [Belnapia rosea]
MDLAIFPRTLPGVGQAREGPILLTTPCLVQVPRSDYPARPSATSLWASGLLRPNPASNSPLDACDRLSLRLKPKPALALSMVLHELAPNATEYGALLETAVA